MQPVNLEEAIKVSDYSAIPDLFTSYTDYRFNSSYRPDFYKIAVPDLEEGDVSISKRKLSSIQLQSKL